MRALFVLLLLVSNIAEATALTWSEIGVGQNVTLRQKFTLGEGGPTFQSGLSLVVLETGALGIPVTLIRMREEVCSEPARTAPMELVTPEGNSESTAVGIQLPGNCDWEIFIEQKDLGTSSLFQ